LLRAELDIKKARSKIVDFISRKVSEADAEGAILGISGGIDSAVTTHLCVEALGSRRVLGLILPDGAVTPEYDVKDARKIASELCVDTKVIDIAPIHRAFVKKLDPNNLAEGNLRARIRMSLLYYHANLMNRLVVGTGDRSELLIGYFTKYGDGGVDILPIADLYKTEVRRLGELLGIERKIILKRSSPRLWVGQTAESEIGLQYEVIDTILRAYFDQEMKVSEIAAQLKVVRKDVEKLVSRNVSTNHKRNVPEICRVR
jgi:NAD+ synthase